MTGTPDYIQPIAGVRIWRVAPNLLSQHMGLLWAPGMIEPWPTGKEVAARCAGHPDHAPPDDYCGCGIYAFYNPVLAFEANYWPIEGDGFYNRLVAGVVGAAGEVIVAEYGWKAARATVEAIFFDGAPDDALPLPRDIIADAYGVPVIDTDDYEAFCEEAGLLIFDEE
jgi:hypothetical protein